MRTQFRIDAYFLRVDVASPTERIRRPFRRNETSTWAPPMSWPLRPEILAISRRLSEQERRNMPVPNLRNPALTKPRWDALRSKPRVSVNSISAGSHDRIHVNLFRVTASTRTCRAGHQGRTSTSSRKAGVKVTTLIRCLSYISDWIECFGDFSLLLTTGPTLGSAIDTPPRPVNVERYLYAYH